MSMPGRNLCDEQEDPLGNGAAIFLMPELQKQNSLSSAILRVSIFAKLKCETHALTNTEVLLSQQFQRI